MQTKRKLPVGITSFPRMIEGNFVYVDKTKIIYDIITAGDCYFFSRPEDSVNLF